MKTITSPVEEYPGTIEFPEGLTLPQVAEYASVSDGAIGKNVYEKYALLLPLQVKMTGKWSIQGLPEKPDVNSFVFTPAGPPSKLLHWLHNEFVNLITGEIPNAQRPRSTGTPKTPAAQNDL